MKTTRYMVLLLSAGMLAGVLAGCGGNTDTISSQQSGSAATDHAASSGQTADVSDAQMVSDTAESLPGSQAGSVSDQDTADAAVSQNGAGNPENAGKMPAYTRVWGPVLSATEDSITIDNRSENGIRGELILQLDSESTRVLDSDNGYPVEMSEIEVDDAVFAYIGQAMTLSLPAQVTAEVVICDLPDSLRVPEFVTVTQMEQQSDGSYLMTTDTAQQYLVPENCEILPYLTRNLVTLADVQPDSTCMVWCDERLTAKKIVLFAQ